MSAHEDIFLKARQIADAVERAAFLERMCAGDTVRRAAVEQMLRDADQADAFFQTNERSSSSRADGEAAGAMIGRYKLLEKIGEGGMGVVFMAQQREPVVRKVALKIIKAGMDTRHVVARFEAERQALALMDHPNIAKVLDGGETETGRPYFVMDLVQGLPITQFCDEAKLSTRERLELFLEVCSAVQHAHQKGIIHRDIKPSNILVTLHGEKPVPKVIDFGIAKATQQPLTDKTLFTQFQQFLGTPAYMSPEQASLSGLDIDTRSDIYALGVLLYELLTGVAPFDGKELLKSGIDEMRRTIREKEPMRPSTRLCGFTAEQLTTTARQRGIEASRLIQTLRGDLDWVVIRCLEKDRVRRYATANDLALDVRRHLNNEAIVARPPTTAYRLQKAIRRNRAAFAGIAGVGLALLSGAILSGWQAVRATRLQRLADVARLNEAQFRTAAEAQALAARRRAYASDMTAAQQALSLNSLGRVRELLDRNRPAAGEVDLRGWEWRYLWKLCRSDEAFQLDGHGYKVIGVAFSPDNQVLASLGKDHLLKLWHLGTRREIARRFFSNEVFALAHSRDGRSLAVAHGNAVTLLDWNGQSPRLETAQHDDEVTAVSFSPDGRSLATGTAHGEVALWDLSTVERVKVGGQYHAWVDTLAFSPDGEELAIGGRRLGIHLLNLTTEVTATLSGHSKWITTLRYGPNGWLISGSMDRTVRIWDVASARELPPAFPEHGNEVWAVSVSPDGSIIASAAGDQCIRLWNLTNHSEIATFRGHANEVVSLAYSPNSQWLASGGKDGSLKVWETRPPPLRLEREELVARADWQGRAFHGGMLTAINADGTCSVWSLLEGRELLRLPTTPGINAVAISSNFLAVGKREGTVLLWDVPRNIAIGDFLSAGRGDGSMRFSPDEQTLAVAGNDGRVCLWDVRSRQQVGQLAGRGAGLKKIAFSSDGRQLVSAFRDGTLAVARVSAKRDLQPLWEIRAHREEINRVVFSTDSRVLATASMDATAKLWDAVSGRELAMVRGPFLALFSASFSPDGQRLATGTGDGRICLWDLNVPSEVSIISVGAYDPIWEAHFVDNDTLTAGGLSRIFMWRAPPWSEIEAAEKARPRNR